MAAKKNLTISEAVDALGELKAKLAPHLKRLAELQDMIKARGDGSYKGTKYEATVTEYDQQRLDVEACRAALSRQFIKGHSHTNHVVRIEVRARKTPSIKAA